MPLRGDIFPLPMAAVVGPPPRRSLGRGARQRVCRRRAIAGAVNECVEALNVAANGGDHASRGFATRSRTNPAQKGVLDRVWSLRNHRPVAGPDFEPEAALRALLQADSRYDEGSAGGLATYGSGEASLPRGQARATALGLVLDGDAAAAVQDPNNIMLLGPEELEGELERGFPHVYHDPGLGRSPRRYAEFIAELMRCGIVGLGGRARRRQRFSSGFGQGQGRQGTREGGELFEPGGLGDT